MWNSEIFMNTFCISSLHNVHFKCTLHCILYLQCIQHMSCPISEQKFVISHALLLSFSIFQSGTQFEQKKDFRGQVPQPTFSYLLLRKADSSGDMTDKAMNYREHYSNTFCEGIQQSDPTVVGFLLLTRTHEN